MRFDLNYNIGVIFFTLLAVLGPGLGNGLAGPGGKIVVGAFSQNMIDGWQKKVFHNETQYKLTDINGDRVLAAVSQSAASGRVKEIRIDLKKYPYLNWRWRIEKSIDGQYDETTKSGDDYAARIYVIYSGGFAVWNTRAINYVWAKNSEKNKVWDNAYAGHRAKMVALRTKKDPLGTWVTEKRNVLQDFKRIFNEDIDHISAVALMSDTDNTQKSAMAYFGDIYFTSE